MTGTGRTNGHWGRWSAVLWPLACIAVLAIGLATGDFSAELAEVSSGITLAALLATLPGQAVAMLLYAAALRALSPSVTYWGCLGARLLRDAADNLLVIFPGLGEVVGARALVLAGARSRAAVTVTVVDKLAETVAQLPFMGLAGIALLHHWDGFAGGGSWSSPAPLVSIAAIAVLIFIPFVGVSLFRTGDGPAARLVGRARREFRLVAAEFHQQKSGIPLAIGLHFLAWLTDGVQVWMAAQAFGLELGLYGAVVIASAAYAVRVALFFIPAGILVQEAAFVAAGLVMGVAAPQALALALVLRLRDIVFGLPLLAWPALEFRHGRRPGTGRAH